MGGWVHGCVGGKVGRELFGVCRQAVYFFHKVESRYRF